MAQPPDQPPQQPGFGPPQQGYGHPQAQPQPQSQPRQPQQVGPYGTPSPYGPSYGQPYGPQPGYGYPPPPPQPPPPGGSRNPFMGRPAMVVAAAVAALLLIGGAAFAITRGGDGGDGGKPVADRSDAGGPKPSDSPVNPGDGSGDGGEDTQDFDKGRKSGEAKVLWYKEAPDAPADGADAPGMWITSKAAVKAAYKELVAYDVGDGRPAWDTITFPQPICAVTSQKSSDDRIVVAYMSGTSRRAKCDRLQQIDLDTGAKGWTAKVADGRLFDSVGSSVELSLSGNTLMVGRSQSGTAYDVRTGRKLYDHQQYDEACFPSGFAGGNRLIAVASCDATKATEHDELQKLDPATGKVEWTRRFDKGWTVERTYSVDPLVVYSTNDDKNSWNISTFETDGSLRSQVAFDADFAPECDWAPAGGDLTGCRGVAADANTLYLPTGATAGADEIVAIDLSTGKEKWRVKSPGDGSMLPVRVEGGALVAYVEPSSSTAGRVVSVPTAGSAGAHTPTTLLRMPASTIDIEGGFSFRDLAWADGRFYLSSTRLTGKDDAREKLMLAYGE